MINYDQLINRNFGMLEQTYSTTDSILYALGVGLGNDLANTEQLRFVYEESHRFSALPTMVVVLADPGFWPREPNTGMQWEKILHGEESIEIHSPIPTAATVTSRMRVVEIVDKGPDKGAFFYTERELYNKATNRKLATIKSTMIGRGDGGFGGPAGPVKPIHSLPDRPPDKSCDLPTLAQAALIYRLSADRNPLHVDPAVAAGAGYDSPILHGLCTLGVASHAILKSCCDYQSERLAKLSLRFSAPVYPGDTIRTEIWDDGDSVSFRAVVPERNVVVLNNGYAVVRR